MKWTEIIESVAASIGGAVDAAGLIALLERAEAGGYELDDLRRAFDDELNRVPFLDVLDQELRTRHATWEPAPLARARAVSHVLPLLLQRIRSIRAGRPVQAEKVRSELKRLEQEAQRVEEFNPRHPQCPQCGSQRLDTHKTTVFGTHLYQRHCMACGDIEEWEDGISLGAAMAELHRKA